MSDNGYFQSATTKGDNKFNLREIFYGTHYTPKLQTMTPTPTDAISAETFGTLLDLLAQHGGEIVCTASLDTNNIEQARASGRMYVDENAIGFVWMPKLERIPETDEEVVFFEKWFPLDVPMPESLKNTDFLFDKKRITKAVDAISAENIVNDNFKGLNQLIEDKDLRQFYKDLIVHCIEGYHTSKLSEFASGCLPKRYDCFVDNRIFVYQEKNDGYWMRADDVLLNIASLKKVAAEGAMMIAERNVEIADLKLQIAALNEVVYAPNAKLQAEKEKLAKNLRISEQHAETEREHFGEVIAKLHEALKIIMDASHTIALRFEAVSISDDEAEAEYFHHYDLVKSLLASLPDDNKSLSPSDGKEGTEALTPKKKEE